MIETKLKLLIVLCIFVVLIDDAKSDYSNENYNQNVIEAGSLSSRENCRERGDHCILDSQCCGDSTCDFVGTAGLVMITKCGKEGIK